MKSIKKIVRWAINIPYREYVLKKISQKSEVTIFRMRLKTHPEVFHPLYFHTTKILIRAISKLPMDGRQVLDMGTGSGAVGIFAAQAGGKVTACDINPAAVALARENAELNRATMTVICSNLFEKLETVKFDYVFFNIPFYPKAAQTFFEAAFNAGKEYETIRRFASQLPSHLGGGGKALIIFSEDCAFKDIAEIFIAAGMKTERVDAVLRFAERFHILTLTTRELN